MKSEYAFRHIQILFIYYLCVSNIKYKIGGYKQLTQIY